MPLPYNRRSSIKRRYLRSSEASFARGKSAKACRICMRARLEMAKCELADDKWMRYDVTAIEQISQFDCRRGADGRPKPTCRRGSHRLHPAARRHLQSRAALPPSRANLRALSRSIRAFSPSRTKRRLFFHAGQRLRAAQQLIIQGQGRAHQRHSIEARNIAPNDALFNVQLRRPPQFTTTTLSFSETRSNRSAMSCSQVRKQPVRTDLPDRLRVACFMHRAAAVKVERGRAESTDPARRPSWAPVPLRCRPGGGPSRSHGTIPRPCRMRGRRRSCSGSRPDWAAPRRETSD